MIKYYILEGRRVVRAKDMMEAVHWYEDFSKGSIARTTVGEVDICTSFLMIDHRLFGKGPPIVFETMCFSPGETDIGDYMRRYSSYQDAVDGHNQTVDKVRLDLAKADLAAEILLHQTKETTDD